jgi:hypothetical protein
MPESREDALSAGIQGEPGAGIREADQKLRTSCFHHDANMVKQAAQKFGGTEQFKLRIRHRSPTLSLLRKQECGAIK